MRWLVRRGVVRAPRFGETRFDVIGWLVQPYLTLGDGSRQMLNQPKPFDTLTAAHRYARAEQARFALRALPAPVQPTQRLRPVVLTGGAS